MKNILEKFAKSGLCATFVVLNLHCGANAADLMSAFFVPDREIVLTTGVLGSGDAPRPRNVEPSSTYCGFFAKSTMNNIQVFCNPQFGEIRTTGTSSNPLFCLSDLCSALGIVNHRNVRARLDDDDVRQMDATDSLGRTQQTTFVTESGMYDVVLRSDVPSAKPFRKWVTSEVLPSIRKHGAYATPQTIESIIANPENGIRLLQALQEERRGRLTAENKVAKLQPLADFATAAFSSDTLISISQAAKILNLGFGRNTLFKKLRDAGVFFANRNEPKQRFIDAKYFNLVEGNPIPRSDGSILIPVTVYCTQKGLAYINHLFGAKRSETRLATIR